MKILVCIYLYYYKYFYHSGQWKNINAKLRDLLVENGPIRCINIDFPKDENSRHFSSSYYILNLSNGEQHNRMASQFKRFR
jgi:hypothetical protein